MPRDGTFQATALLYGVCIAWIHCRGAFSYLTKTSKIYALNVNQQILSLMP